MQLQKITLLGTAIIALAPIASAQSWYVDGGYFYAETDEPLSADSIAFESPDLSFGLAGGHIGYEFSPYFSIEGEVLFGVEDDTLGDTTIELLEESVDVNLSLDINQVFGAYARGSLPLGEQFSVFGRAGVVTTEFEVSATAEDIATITETEWSEALAVGIGGEFDLTEQIYLRGDYTRYEYEDVGANTLMASLGFRF